MCQRKSPICAPTVLIWAIQPKSCGFGFGWHGRVRPDLTRRVFIQLFWPGGCQNSLACRISGACIQNVDLFGMGLADVAGWTEEPLLRLSSARRWTCRHGCCGDQCSRPIVAATSAIRAENPHSLSYHANTRTVLPPTTFVWSGAKMQLWVVWLKSMLTFASAS